MSIDKSDSQEFNQKFADGSESKSVSRWQSHVDATTSFVDRHPFPGHPDVNAGIVHMMGSSGDMAIATTGVQDFGSAGSHAIDGNTMFGEGSIGKVRFAGLGYMLQQDGAMDMQANASALFAEPGFKDFINQKYGESHPTGADGVDIGTQVQQQIASSFTGNSSHATLADLTTHYSGVGDLTRDQFVVIRRDGIEKLYDFPTLIAPVEGAVVPRDEHGKPRAQSSPDTPNDKLPQAEYGKHQYSNLGYAMFAEAMEYSYQKAQKENPEQFPQKADESLTTYKDLLNDYMLHPTRGHAAKSGLSFDNTKFPEQLAPGDNVFAATRFDETGKGDLANANVFTGASAAGGMFASASDSSKFFSEFFKGFPGTPEYGKVDNPFFTKETIQSMEQEWKKRPADPNTKDATKDQAPYHGSYQGPGFVARVEDGVVTRYDKGGDTFSYGSMMTFQPKENVVSIDMKGRENITPTIAKDLGITTEQLMGAYQKDGKFDRTSLFNDYKEKGIDEIKFKVDLEGVTKGMANLNINEAKEAAKNLKGVQLQEAGNSIAKSDSSPSVSQKKQQDIEK